jgi:hypothetical protein
VLPSQRRALQRRPVNGVISGLGETRKGNLGRTYCHESTGQEEHSEKSDGFHS